MIHRVFCVFACVLVLVLSVQSQSVGFAALPTCAQGCVNSSYPATCDPFTDISCACNDAASLGATRQCIATACTPKDGLTTLNLTSVACDAPVRDKSTSYRILNIVFFSLAVLAIATRYAVHFSVGRLRWLDDGNMAIVFLLDILLIGVCLKMSYLGLGHDMWKVPFHQISSLLFFFWISEITYLLVIGFVRISFLLFYLQIFPNKWFRITVWTCIGFVLSSTTAFFLAATFGCHPVSFFWNAWDGEHKGKCFDNFTLGFVHAGMGITADFITLSLPVTQIWKLQMGTKKKVGVLLMFSVGAFVTVVSILRLKSLIYMRKTSNVTWYFIEASLWSVIEVQVGIICVCMPSIRMGLVRFFPNALGSTAQSTSKPTYGGRSEGATLGTTNANGIAVQTSFRISHSRKPQTHDHESFVQLVEIDGDAKSTATRSEGP